MPIAGIFFYRCVLLLVLDTGGYRQDSFKGTCWYPTKKMGATRSYLMAASETVASIATFTPFPWWGRLFL